MRLRRGFSFYYYAICCGIVNAVPLKFSVHPI
nr:MAG TPA: hypothetical protein [Caudoviricetes sp.]